MGLHYTNAELYQACMLIISVILGERFTGHFCFEEGAKNCLNCSRLDKLDG